MIGPRQSLIPPTLLTKPLPPELINRLSEDEKRLYQIQKGKYDAYLRILEKKKQTHDHPTAKVFSLADSEKLMQGRHHEDDLQDDEDEEDLNQMKYLGRDEFFH